ncbi:MAG: hypothetical protein KAS12_01855 [Candidatus Aenigmarchaeota archaeon]|nr:hypothetical protein [Candidatus Aenigmarchaeota archaeon]
MDFSNRLIFHKPIVIALLGDHGIGKNYLAEKIGNFRSEDFGNIPAINIQELADPLKDIICKILGVSREKIENSKRTKKLFQVGNRKMVMRDILRLFGEGMKTLDNKIWVKKLFTELSLSEINIIPDLRFLEEYTFLKEHVELFIVRLGNPITYQLSQIPSNFDIPSNILLTPKLVDYIPNLMKEFYLYQNS